MARRGMRVLKVWQVIFRHIWSTGSRFWIMRSLSSVGILSKDTVQSCSVEGEPGKEVSRVVDSSSTGRTRIEAVVAMLIGTIKL